ncbi:MAG TPA: PHP domain-containing protein [Muribaculaceae bacterium]|nr:PHP domain-containing protein [Muribaculaceae bacterium]
MKDFRSIIGTDTAYNFHSHTQFCDGHADIAAFAEAAAKAEMHHYGYSPHSPVPIDSPCNMKAEDVPAYFAEVEAAQRRWPQMHIYRSMEVDYLGTQWGPSSRYFRDLGLDYVIGSVHFIPAKDDRSLYIDIDGSPERFMRNMHTHFGDDIEYVARTFYDHSAEMLARGGLDILGHLDKIEQNGVVFDPDLVQHGWYLDAIDAFLHEVTASGITVEVNTKALARLGRLFPDERWMPRIIADGVPVVVNSDAHDPALIDAGRPYALRIIQKLRDEYHQTD